MKEKYFKYYFKYFYHMCTINNYIKPKAKRCFRCLKWYRWKVRPDRRWAASAAKAENERDRGRKKHSLAVRKEGSKSSKWQHRIRRHRRNKAKIYKKNSLEKAKINKIKGQGRTKKTPGTPQTPGIEPEKYPLFLPLLRTLRCVRTRRQPVAKCSRFTIWATKRCFKIAFFAEKFAKLSKNTLYFYFSHNFYLEIVKVF